MFSLPEKVYRDKLLKINEERNTSVDYTSNRCSQQLARCFCTLASERTEIFRDNVEIVGTRSQRKRFFWLFVRRYAGERNERTSPSRVFPLAISTPLAPLCFLIETPLFLHFRMHRPQQLRKTVSQETRLLFSQRLLNVPDHKINRWTSRHRSYYNLFTILFGIFFSTRFSRKLETKPSINIYIAAHATDIRAILYVCERNRTNEA